MRHEQNEHQRSHGDRGVNLAGDQVLRHAVHSLRHDSDSRSLQTEQPACLADIAQLRDAQRERHHEQHRRQREAHPRQEHAQVPGALQADRHTHLARRRPGQELAQRHQVGVLLVRKPLPLLHEFVAEIPQVRRRPAERGAAEAEEDSEDAQWRSHASSLRSTCSIC